MARRWFNGPNYIPNKKPNIKGGKKLLPAGIRKKKGKRKV